MARGGRYRRSGWRLLLQQVLHPRPDLRAERRTGVAASSMASRCDRMGDCVLGHRAAHYPHPRAVGQRVGSVAKASLRHPAPELPPAPHDPGDVGWAIVFWVTGLLTTP